MKSETSDGRSLQEATDRLRRLQAAGRLGTWDWNVLTNELTWDGVEAIHGLPEGSFGGRFEGYLADMHRDDREDVLNAIHSARETGTDLEIEYRIVLPGGSIRWVCGRGTCILDSVGNTIAMSGTCQEITERKEAEQWKEDAFAAASHELRNPLTVILGFSRMLERRLARVGEPLDDVAIEAIQTISAESQRLALTVETLLNVWRTELPSKK